MTALERLTSSALPERPVLFVPLGSTEQHGPHLPTGTDSHVARWVCQMAASALSGLLPVVTAPAVAYGASGEHEAFPGTVSIGHEALSVVLLELGRSATRWAERVVFVNGHGGNVPTVGRAVLQLRGEGRRVAWLPCDRPDADAHAGAFETSLMLALAPETVMRSSIRPGVTTPLAELMPALRAGGVRAVSDSGVLGDPTRADASRGRAAGSGMARDLVRGVLGWEIEEATGRLRV
ncbi:MAG TPA: mycofactocin biosynthesis peptidyl-dipeptidase MftE [Dermatophilaceae bacterium]|nr:mycofactocin biosynthesis peptidyl-dipeptidase MftE [Dermatophilaceae bacterium]